MPTGTTELLALARLAVGEGYLALESSPEGLAPDEIRRRLHRYGPNLIAREQQPSLARELWRRASNPLNALLATIATASFALDDARAGFVILVMVALSILMAWVQEHRSNEAAARLRALVKTSASVRRKVPLSDLSAGTR